jgi:signal transduction histidine kinase/DNA-binding response OmpR family regulator
MYGSWVRIPAGSLQPLNLSGFFVLYGLDCIFDFLKTMKKIILLLVFLSFYQCFSQTESLKLRGDYLNICPSTFIFEDTTGSLSFEEVQQKTFISHQKQQFIFPFSNHVFWVKFNLKNQSNENDWVLVWENAMVENLTFFIPNENGTFHQVKEGCLVYKNKNRFAENTVSVPFNTFDKNAHIFYVKIQSQRGHQANFEVYSDSKFIDYKLSSFKKEGFMNGLFALRIVYLILLAFFVVKDKTFRQYSILTIFRSIGYWGLLGILGASFTTNTKLALHINQQAYYLMPLWFSIVLYSFLEIHRFPKFFRIILKIIPFLTVFLCLNIIIFYKWYWLKAATIMYVFSIFFILLLYIISIIKKYKVEWSYSIPFLLGICSNVHFPARLLGMKDFPGSGIFSTTLFIAEIIVFGLFLGRIIRNYEKNRIITNNELMFNKEQASKLKALDVAKNNFFTNISHEFRTPLTLILAPVEDLINENPNNAVFKIIHRNAYRLLELINQLLDIGKLEDGQMKVMLEKTDLVKYFRTLTSSFSSLAESKGISFEFSQDKQNAIGFIDKDKVEKIVGNLLSNAFKFTEKGKKVSVEIIYKTDIQSVSIEIIDEGIGISNEKILRIFDRFYQIDDTRNRKYEGTGIGLALVKELVNVLEGKIRVESQENIGTSFLVILPINDLMISSENIGISKDEINRKTSHFKIEIEIKNDELGFQKTEIDNILLVVDDNADIREYIRGVFENSYQIIEASNGKEGLLKAIEITPTLVISDLMMPEMDGLEFCKKLKSEEKTSHIPVVMLTAKATLESKIEGLELGADDYLLKPFNAKEIQVRVKNLIEKQEKLRQYFTQKTIVLKPTEINVNSKEEAFLKKVMAVIENNLADNQFNVEQFSLEMNMSQSQLVRKLKALTNLTANEFLRHFRLQRAAELLEKKSGTVSEIAFQVGFEHLSYFSKVFQEKFNKLPSEY